MDPTLLRQAKTASTVLQMVGDDAVTSCIADYNRRLEEQQRFLARTAAKATELNAVDPDEFMNRIAGDSYALARWAQQGYNTFDLTDGLAASLLLTDCTTAPRDVAFPFDAFMVRIPTGLLPIQLDGGVAWCRYLMVTHYRAEHDAPALRITGLTGDGGRLTGSLWVCHTIDRFADPEFYDYNALVKSLDDDPEPVPLDSVSMQALVRLTFNLCQWLEANGGLKTSKVRPARVKGSVTSVAAQIYPALWIVGREVKVGHAVLAEARRLALDSTTRSSWRLHAHHWVRGHFKQQPHGPGGTLRKRLWIAPYERGPTDGPEVMRRYNCDEAERSVEVIS